MFHQVKGIDSACFRCKIKTNRVVALTPCNSENSHGTVAIWDFCSMFLLYLKEFIVCHQRVICTLLCCHKSCLSCSILGDCRSGGLLLWGIAALGDCRSWGFSAAVRGRQVNAIKLVKKKTRKERKERKESKIEKKGKERESYISPGHVYDHPGKSPISIFRFGDHNRLR